ncbi:MAG: peptidase domain-containing ABC transporter [Kordiimonadaceae bacterium]|nr:peptidase domain-containing ABC transporter [Kordiimonadaceae bacterium]MBO6569215.1 peptidase domain-containing ABC transporter [Kordiimonadaceae bacterium]MBO6964691.1 peptidase domain-containing ABC transporter [Kordiimonadaceae bacterium]
MNLDALNFSNRKTLPIVRQNEAAECGLASLAMIAGYHGYDTDLSSLRRKYATGLQGMTLRHVIDVANNMRFASRPVKVPLDKISSLKVPAILHWDMNHFVVLKSVKGNKITVHDPARGECNYTKEEFSQHFTGIALECTPTDDFEKGKERVRLKLSDLWSNIVGFRRSLQQAIILSVLLQLMVLVGPFYMQVVIDDVLTTFDADLLLVLALGFAAVKLIGVFVETLRGYVLLYFGSMLSFQMVGNLFRHLIHLPAEFFEKRHIGDITSRFGSMEPIKQMLTEGLVASIIDGVMAITTLMMMFLYNPLLAAIALGIWFVYLVLRLSFYRSLRAAQEDAIVSQAKEQSNFMETIRGIVGVKLHGGESLRSSLWQNNYASVINANARVAKLNIWFKSAQTGMFGTELVIIIYVAATMVMAGDFSVGMLFAFMAYKRNFTDKAAALVEKFIEFRMLNLHLERIADIAHADQENLGDDLPAVCDGPSLQGHITLREIRYRYSHNTPYVLSGADLDVGVGESIALIGPSGCGKTTLLKIMAGLLQPDDGQLLIDGVSLSEYGLRRYRKQVGVVMQEDDLFAGSIAENIAFFDPEIDMQRVVEAAKTAQIYDEIMAMPMRFESLVGDMGAAFSGGQKQRIVLARALYRQPTILFMDEGTAHLDVNTERCVNQSIAELGMTRIIVAHRPETIRSADRIFEMQNGHLQEVDGQSLWQATKDDKNLESFNVRPVTERVTA